MSTIKAGTTSTTAYQVEADTTGNLVIATGTSANVAMTVNSSGNIGIGTSSPTYKFHVAGTGGYVARFDRTATTSGLDIGADSSGAILQPFGVDAIQFYNAAGTTRNMLLNASGNLGLGVTPSAWGSPFVPIQLANTGQYIAGQNGGADLKIGTNHYYNGSNYVYTTSGNPASRFDVGASTNAGFAWQVAASGTAGNTISFTQAMTLTAAGELLVGTTAVAQSDWLTSTPVGVFSANNNAQLRVHRPSAGDGVGAGALLFAANDGSGNQKDICVIRSETTAANAGGGALAFFTRPNSGSLTERARITSGGFLLVGDTTHTDGSIFTATGFTPLSAYRISTTAAQGIFGCYSDTGGTKTVRAYFQVDGGLANYSANDVNLSDQRVKDNINPAGSYWNKIKALEIVTFRYKDQDENDQNIGVIAQQVETVAPEFVSNDGFGETPEGEEPLKTVYTTDMYHAAIKALQEAMARIEALEAKVAAAGL